MIKIDGFLPSDAESWLCNLSKDEIENGLFPLEQLLQGSFYYPSSGVDGGPILDFSFYVQSFVYVDYIISKERALQEMESFEKGGYSAVGVRDLREQDLNPTGWTPNIMPDKQEDERLNMNFLKFPVPYAVWVVFERHADRPETHGPKRFSLIMMCADGAAAYQAIYNSNGLYPRWIAIIQPGTGFGFNYTDFTNQKKILYKSVSDNSRGRPELLVYGGYGKNCYNTPCWQEYKKSIAVITGYYPKNEGEVVVFKR